LSFLIVNLNLFSQDSVVVYLDKAFEQTTKDSASLIRKAVVKENRICLTDMNPDGSKIVYCEFASLNPRIEDGKAIYYKNNDSIFCTGNYKTGQMSGKWIYYDRENHADTIDYSFINDCTEKKSSKLPDYLSGDSGIEEAGTDISQSLPPFIKANFHLPARAKSDSISDIHQVIYCIVGTDGRIKCPRIMNSIHPDIDLEIYRILNMYQYHGVVKSPFVIPSVIFDNTAKKRNDDSDEVYVVVEEMPRFPGGDETLLKFIAANLQYPEEAKENGIQGTVILRFCVKKDGTVGQITIAKGVDASLNAEAYRVASILPPFIPGKQRGKPVNVWYSIPIRFNLK